ncbi:DUF2164 domain-containing protein [Shewanella sp. 1_MG-2023]|jgi:uncharacterized protein (DUF2164 family)|uniref:DUF2164 domain-containing protein n=1 Tax=Shewanella electrodiphila TaxID=934143 RepID=A0ABT0KUR8_9GAMM|nr:MULTISPECIES: DUF2164 domain-containing protein [Shewanella]MCL1047581.1 DUF2164 domain-containing protein [Shewanella electrodiphila]MDO6613623.1 DUF2164 domain-containing protein [Shewanella sp. 7_MG-2023]MDO6773406.1 DUF2164 domain-containing protein [Shewanella sp. 2_MG-2023]MDO6796273.1 DUF2164 domain-containing protein [Shewanella sp. 1_MG-2023]PMG78537.1 hypothetical protein BCU84_08045 [Shewanella sp. 10N.286.51.B7]
MSKIEFTAEQRELMVQKIQTYFEDELDQDLGQFDAEFLLDFFASNIGAHFYNRGLHDARAIFEARIETIDEDIYGIEKDIK